MHILMRTQRRYARSPCHGRCNRRAQCSLHTSSYGDTQGYQRAGLITADELTLIKKVERQPKAKTESLLLSDGAAYAHLYLRLLKKLQRVDTQQCILVLIADAIAGRRVLCEISAGDCNELSDHDERIPLFTRTQELDIDLPYGPLLR